MKIIKTANAIISAITFIVSIIFMQHVAIAMEITDAPLNVQRDHAIIAHNDSLLKHLLQAGASTHEPQSHDDHTKPLNWTPGDTPLHLAAKQSALYAYSSCTSLMHHQKLANEKGKERFKEARELLHCFFRMKNEGHSGATTLYNQFKKLFLPHFDMAHYCPLPNLLSKRNQAGLRPYDLFPIALLHPEQVDTLATRITAPCKMLFAYNPVTRTMARGVARFFAAAALAGGLKYGIGTDVFSIPIMVNWIYAESHIQSVNLGFPVGASLGNLLHYFPIIINAMLLMHLLQKLS